MDTQQRRSTPEDYGQERYTYLRGSDDRYSIGGIRTILPGKGETNEQFQQRMHLMALQLLGMSRVASVSVTFDRSDGSLVRCLVNLVESPEVAPIDPDSRPAGGHFGERGERGSRGRRGGLRKRQLVTDN